MNEERILNIILSPHISEKATMASEKRNEYVFEVAPDANKNEIKVAIEHLFSTEVIQVRIVNVKPKVKRFKNILGRKKGWKKAYVSLAEGKRIDFGDSAKTTSN